MGMFDKVMVPCPECGTQKEFQSKSGACRLDEYTLKDVPPDVILDINRHSPHTCGKCKAEFRVGFKVVVTDARPILEKDVARYESYLNT